MYIYSVDDYREIYSPTHVGLSSPTNEVIVLPLTFNITNIRPDDG